MATSSENTLLTKGEYAPATSIDLRSPCPMVNCLANHGYIARDGRSIHANELYAAVREVGLGVGLAAAFAYPIFYEHHPKANDGRSWWERLLAKLNPLTALGMRRPGQTDAMRRPVLDLDQLALPGVIEHDISLTRRDHQQAQGNSALQSDLVEGLLRSSKDGKIITREDLAEYRKHRIAVQREENPGLLYGGVQKLLSYGEISLILDVIGDGEEVPVEYARAFLLEERLPSKEGWRSRSGSGSCSWSWGWWQVGIIGLQISIFKVWCLVGRDV